MGGPFPLIDFSPPLSSSFLRPSRPRPNRRVLAPLPFGYDPVSPSFQEKKENNFPFSFTSHLILQLFFQVCLFFSRFAAGGNLGSVSWDSVFLGFLHSINAKKGGRSTHSPFPSFFDRSYIFLPFFHRADFHPLSIWHRQESFSPSPPHTDFVFFFSCRMFNGTF